MLPGLPRGHHLIRVGCDDPGNQLARIRFPGDYRIDGAFWGVQAQISLAPLLVEAVTGEAVFGENLLDIPIECDFWLGCCRSGDQQEQPKARGDLNQKRNDH